MNIEKFFGKKSENPIEEKYASSFRRSLAAGIDMWIVLFLRIIIAQFLAIIWINKEITDFLVEFQNTFGTETIKNTPEHIDFIIHHRAFFCGIIFYAIIILIGALYHALLNSSAWQGTIGKRLVKIVIVTAGEKEIGFWRAFSHYLLSVAPFIFIFYLLSYQARNHLNFFQALTASEANLFFGICFIFWIQIHLFTKRKTTAYDLICDTILINKKTAALFPWNKVKC